MAMSFRLREAARTDLTEIGRYTLKNHGKAQRDKYLLGLNRLFESLAKMPLKGRQCNEIKEGYYSHHYEKHVVYYRIHSDYIEILGVLHQRMLPDNHLT